MPLFDFSTVKSAIRKNNSTFSNKSKILEKDVSGIVWIDKAGQYYVLVDNSAKYDIDENCYSCKNEAVIYAKFLDSKGNRIRIIRSDNFEECSKKFYLPFAPGCAVKGNIIIKNNKKVFYIKEVLHNTYNNHTAEALNFYRDNYEEIKKIIMSK